jgi:periplasmic protein TonB
MSSLTEQIPPPPAANSYEQETSGSKRAWGVVIALVLHVLLIYGFTSGLATDLVKKVQKTVNVAIIPESKPTPPPPRAEEIEADSQPQKRQRAQTKAYVPKAEVQVTKQVVANTISGVTDRAEEATPSVEKAAPVLANAPSKPEGPAKTMARLMRGCRLPQYPKRSEEKGEEGTVVLRFLVGTDGSVQSSQLVRSSGFERLDAAAKEAFMKCKFTPGTIDGASVSSWVRQPFTWRLK